eukprot:6184894-Pleurochrysis_carterae.AAC.1
MALVAHAYGSPETSVYQLLQDEAAAAPGLQQDRCGPRGAILRVLACIGLHVLLLLLKFLPFAASSTYSFRRFYSCPVPSTSLIRLVAVHFIVVVYSVYAHLLAYQHIHLGSLTCLFTDAPSQRYIRACIRVDAFAHLRTHKHQPFATPLLPLSAEPHPARSSRKPPPRSVRRLQFNCQPFCGFDALLPLILRHAVRPLCLLSYHVE